MSWEYSRFEARCAECGRTGVRIEGANDWGQSTISWEGFDTTPADWVEVARHRVDQNMPICNCGGTNVVVGAYIGNS